MHKDPYEKKTYDQVKAESRTATNDVVTTLDKSSLPISLVQFIKSCTDPDPAKRGTFLAILRQKPFPTFFSQYLDATRGEARVIYNVQTLKMPWRDFVSNWGQKFSPLSHKQEKALRICLGVNYAEDLPTTSVEKAKFDLFLGWFGPITAKTLPNFWKFATQLLSEPFFHAEITDSTARERLRSGPTDNNNYLVRLNTGTKTEERDEPFVICYRMESKGKTRTYEIGFRPRYDSPQTPSEYVAAAFKDKAVTGLAACSYDRSNAFKIWPKETDEPIAVAKSGATANEAKGYVFDAEGLANMRVNLEDT